MAKIYTKHGDDKPIINKGAVLNFFEKRAQKINQLGPIRAVIYQDKNPNLAEKRDIAEKNLLFPHAICYMLYAINGDQWNFNFLVFVKCIKKELQFFFLQEVVIAFFYQGKREYLNVYCLLVIKLLSTLYCQVCLRTQIEKL